jgi:hypothetical protein
VTLLGWDSLRMACTSAALIKSFGSTISPTAASLGTSTTWLLEGASRTCPASVAAGYAQEAARVGRPDRAREFIRRGSRRRPCIGHTRLAIRSVSFDVAETIANETREHDTSADWLGYPACLRRWVTAAGASPSDWRPGTAPWRSMSQQCVFRVSCRFERR